MQLILALGLSLSLGTAALAEPAPQPASKAALASLLADYDRFNRQVDPITASQNGDREALRRLPDDSPAALAAQKAALAAFRIRITTLSAAPLTGEDALDRDLLGRTVDDQLQSLGFDEARLPFNAIDSFNGSLEQLAELTAISTPDDADAWLARLSDMPRQYATETGNARRGLATGFIQPRPTVQAALATAQAQADAPVQASPLLKPFAALPPTIAPARQAELRAQALAIVRDRIKPAQVAYARFLQADYLPHARASLAARDLPDGERYYAYVVRHHTTTDLTPDQIHALGLREVARIRAEMTGAIAATGFKGSFEQFQVYLRSEPRFYPKTRQELLDAAAFTAKLIDEALPREFGRLPRLPFTVRPVPASSEEAQTTAYYDQGSPALGIAGNYYVNLSHLDQRPLYELPALTLHEAEPGHHLQIALAQELTDLPSFRRDAYVTAYVEGWGLYAEQLGEDMHIYRDPYEEFGRLSYEMWRACRLVADTGIHWLRWAKDQAKACFLENTALTPKNIDVEVDRYIGWPGQALAYKVGELKIMELRHRAEAALGAKFDIRAFHDAVLLEGPLPLDVLERRIDAWIAERKAAG